MGHNNISLHRFSSELHQQNAFGEETETFKKSFSEEKNFKNLGLRRLKVWVSFTQLPLFQGFAGFLRHPINFLQAGICCV